MKRLEIDVPHKALSKFARDLAASREAVRSFELNEVNEYMDGGRMTTNFRRYAFYYNTKEEKDATVAVAKGAAEFMSEKIRCREYNVSEVMI